ncbi:nucleotidyltransferase family protein [Flavobacterium eburneipallidum]|uniref:nucleotidyltransferase family protein n=1 Tax=Flavobacterium eburneipallidum TaxID=3003263 RepID=UPI0022ABE8E0|nr:nucleotidyltransferase domain-containing protein [Flavobacterium eburneipallidum]
MIHPNFQSNLPIIIDLFKKHKIKNAYFFGSILTDKFNDESDLDILINFKPEITDPLLKGELMWNLQFAIEDTFHRSVDLLQESTPKNPYFIKELQETKELIYEQ